MPRPALIWLEGPGLEGLDREMVARAAQVELAEPGRGLAPEAAVVTRAEARTPESVKSWLQGKPVQWLDLGAEVGGGQPAHRLARAAAAVARAAGRAGLGVLAPVYAPQPAQRVLVFGQGVAALLAAHAVAGLGHPVLLAWSGEDPSRPAAGDDPQEATRLGALLPAGVELSPRTDLTRLEGAAGAFTAWLEDVTGRRAERFGAVLLAPPATWTGEAPPAGLRPELVARLDQAPEPPAGDGWRRVAILAGVNGPATAAGFSLALKAALAMQAQPRMQAHVFFREALVAEPGGERLYRQAREAGALMVRVPEGGLRVSADGRGLAWDDPVLGEELELWPDLVLAGARLEAGLPQALANPVLWPQGVWLTPEHARLGGGRTSRSGLYLLGAVSGAQSAAAAQVSAAAAAAEAHDLLGGRATPLPVVRHNHCASCLTCVRVCPHGVPRYDNDCITPAPAACVGCGICAAECPAQAIAPVGWAQNELLEGLRRGLALAAKPSLVVMACGQSALPAARELSLAGHQWPAGVLWLPLPCAGRAGMELIMRTLALGASGVLVAGCHEGMCRSLAGNLRARLRVGEAAATLRELGLTPEAVAFLPLASNQPLALKDAVTALHGRLAARGE